MGGAVLLALDNLTRKGHTGKRRAHLAGGGRTTKHPPLHPGHLCCTGSLPLFFRKTLFTNLVWDVTHNYVYMKEGELKRTCQHIVIALGIDPSPYMWHFILPMTTGLGCPRLCILCTLCMGQSWGHAEPGQWWVILQQRWGPWQHCLTTAWFNITQCQVWGKRYDQNSPQALSTRSLFFPY